MHTGAVLNFIGNCVLSHFLNVICGCVGFSSTLHLPGTLAWCWIDQIAQGKRCTSFSFHHEQPCYTEGILAVKVATQFFMRLMKKRRKSGKSLPPSFAKRESKYVVRPNNIASSFCC